MAAADRCQAEGAEEEEEPLGASGESQVGNGSGRERELLLATADGNAGASCCGERRAYCDHERRGVETSGVESGGDQRARRRKETRVGGQTTTTAGVSLQDSIASSPRPVILITEPAPRERGPESASGESECSSRADKWPDGNMEDGQGEGGEMAATTTTSKQQDPSSKPEVTGAEEDQFEVIDGISYRIVAAVTRKPQPTREGRAGPRRRQSLHAANRGGGGGSASTTAGPKSRFSSVRRKSSAFVANLLHSGQSFLVPQSRSSNALSAANQDQQPARPRRMSIYEMTKTPPPETSIEMYLNERRRSSTVSAKFVAQQLEQQSTFETNYCARQQYFKDLNAKLINQDKKLLNVVANRGQIHRHSVDIAQLPLFLATQSSAARVSSKEALDSAPEVLREEDEEQLEAGPQTDGPDEAGQTRGPNFNYKHPLSGSINQVPGQEQDSSGDLGGGGGGGGAAKQRLATTKHLAAISEDRPAPANEHDDDQRQRDALGQRALASGGPRRTLAGGQIVRRFQKFDSMALSSAPSPDVKIGQRVAYKEYYGNEFGTIRWIGRVPQISPDWTVGVEFDNAIGEGDGSLNGRRYFIAKDCFAKFLALSSVTLVDQHVGRPEPGTMISVMSAAVRPGQMISIQRVSTVHVQHCFLNAPHRRPGAEFLAVNTRLHCQCPNCGPCAHVVKPPRTQRLVTPKNATHMCQFSTYTCCGMESSDEALCTYTGNKISSLPPPPMSYATGGSLPPLGNSWMDGSGYLSQLQAEQRKLMPEEYRLGAAPEDAFSHAALVRRASGSGKRRSGQNQQSSDRAPPACDNQGRDSLSASPNAQTENEPHHHRHHRHHHHRRRHKSPVVTSPTGGERANQPEEQLPIHVNLDGAGQTRHDGRLIDMQNEGTTPVDADLGVGEARLSGNGHSSTSGAAEEMLRNQDGETDEDRRLVRALRAVQHRDSIENRYLFPTDDIIDSLLEADLETLSQARYGGANSAAPGRRGHSSASSSTSAIGGGGRQSGRGRGRSHRPGNRRRSSSALESAHPGRPNAILARLRSLVVSCMSAADANGSPCKSNHAHSDLAAAAYATTCAPTFSPAALADSESSRPLGAWRDEHAECYCGHQAPGQGAYSTALTRQTTITNEIVTTNGGLFASELDQPHQEKQETLAEQANKAHPALLYGCAHDPGLDQLASDHLYSNDLNLDPFECDKLAGRPFKPAEPRRQKLICSHAGRRARGATGARRPAPASRACRHRRGRTQKHRHASSSSDCGFSSASQNSINVSQRTEGARQPLSPLEHLEKRAVNDLYRRLTGLLANHLSAAGDTQQEGQSAAKLSHEELLKLRRALFEMHSETCCLHHQSSTLSHSPLSSREFEGSESQLAGGPTQDCALLLVADLLRRTSSTNNHNERDALDWCTCASATCRGKQASSGSCDSGHLSSPVCNLSERHGPKRRDQSQFEEDSASTVQMDELDEREQQEGRGSRAARPSPSEPTASVKRADVHLTDEAANTVAAANSLPRAFELKLTLSINPDQTTGAQMS